MGKIKITKEGWYPWQLKKKISLFLLNEEFKKVSKIQAYFLKCINLIDSKNILSTNPQLYGQLLP